MKIFLFVNIFLTFIVGRGNGLKCNVGIWYSKNEEPFNVNSMEDVIVDANIEECTSGTHCITYSGSFEQDNGDKHDVKFLGWCVEESFCKPEQTKDGFDRLISVKLPLDNARIDEGEKPIVAACCNTDVCNDSEPPRLPSSGKNITTVFSVFYFFQLFAVLGNMLA